MISYGYVVQWSERGVLHGIEVSDCATMGEAVSSGVLAAIRAGWAPRRWWQWWRWNEVQPKLFEALKYLAEVEVKVKEEDVTL